MLGWVGRGEAVGVVTCHRAEPPGAPELSQHPETTEDNTFGKANPSLLQGKTATERKAGKGEEEKPKVRAGRKAGHQQEWRERLIN